jgi:hypothetical protein
MDDGGAALAKMLGIGLILLMYFGGTELTSKALQDMEASAARPDGSTGT